MLSPEITPPVDLPVTLAQIKAQAIVDFGDDDVLLDSHLRAATAYLDGSTGVLGRALMPQSVVQRFDGFSHCMALPYGPALALTGVTYQDENDATQTLTGWTLYNDTNGSYIRFPSDTVFPQTYDRPDAVSVSYSAGYSGAGAVPESLKLAIAMLATTWYSVREDMTTGASYNNVPYGVHALIAPHRRVGV